MIQTIKKLINTPIFMGTVFTSITGSYICLVSCITSKDNFKELTYW